jgi:serine protease AprX
MSRWLTLMAHTQGQWLERAMVGPPRKAHRYRVHTLRQYSARTLLLLASSLGLLVGTVAPATADTAPLATWLVTYNAPPSSYQLDTLGGLSSATHGFSSIPVAVVVAPASAVTLLRALPGVKGVYPNETYHYLSDLATQSSGASQVWQDLGWTGAGIGVAVIDAGVDGSHPDLCAAAEFCHGTPVKTVQNVKILGREETLRDPVVLLENQINTDSSSGHGSHVAGIAAGWGSAGSDPTRYRGVAYGANLIGFGTGEAVEAENVLAAFDYSISHKDQYNIKVINNSWGPGAFTPYDPDHPVNLAIDAAWNAGISVVFGAGNDGTRTDSLNMFSANPHSISVGSGTKNHQQAFYSSRGVPGNAQLHPTVTAPGDSITSVRASTGFTIDAADAQTVAAPDGDAPSGTDSAYYAVSSGTSMASPHIAGVVALMQQAAKASLNRYLTPLEVRNILQNTATPMPGYQQYSVGAGFVNALAAVQAATTATQTGGYSTHLSTDVVPFAGTAGGDLIVPTSTFSSTYTVLPGAVSMDVMIDWGPEKVLPANTDLDIDLIRPDGSTFAGTFLACDPNAAPNGYSSYCTSAPNERLSVVSPVAGTWTVNVHPGLVGVQESVRGLWSTTYPDTMTLPARPGPATLTLTASQPAQLAGQSVDLTATVKDASGLPLPNISVDLATTGVGTVGHRTTVTDTFGRIHAQATSVAPGTQTVAATAAGLSSAVSLTWLGIVVPPVTCVLNCPAPVTDSVGKMSGGGWWSVSGVKHHLAASAAHSAGSSTNSGDLSYDNAAGTTVSGTGVEHFVLDGSKATVTGTCTVNGSTGYRYTLTVVDNGEPGTSDTVHLVVTQTGTTWKLDDGGTLGGGNMQVSAG